MKKYSENVEQWLNLMHTEMKSYIDSYNSLDKRFGKSVKDKYKDVRDYFIWSVERQSKNGAVGPVESSVEEYWNKATKNVREELGGTKSEAAKVVGELLNEEYGIDIRDEIIKNSDPCYALRV